MTVDRVLRAGVGVLVASVAALAFLVSFESIKAYAVHVGAFTPRHGWAAPLLVDSFVVAGSLAGLRRSLAGRRAVYPWTLVAAGSVVSVALNVAHAPPTLAARAVAALPPAALLAGFELLLSEARTGVHPQDAQVSAPGTARERVRALLEGEDVSTPLTARAAAKLVGVSRSRAGALLAEERAARVSMNGSGGDGRHDG
jgi:hypothetical protein